MKKVFKTRDAANKFAQTLRNKKNTKGEPYWVDIFPAHGKFIVLYSGGIGSFRINNIGR